MTLDRFNPSEIAAQGVELDKSIHHNVAEMFAYSALYELHRSAFGLAQTVGLQDHVGTMEQPAEADSGVGRFFQVIGRGTGSFLPTLAVAMTTRYGFGKVLDRIGADTENLALKRSALGLSTAESATTGFISGSLFKSTDDTAAQSWSTFAADRFMGGSSGALSFTALNLATMGWSRLAKAVLPPTWA